MFEPRHNILSNVRADVGHSKVCCAVAQTFNVNVTGGIPASTSVDGLDWINGGTIPSTDLVVGRNAGGRKCQNMTVCYRNSAAGIRGMMTKRIRTDETELGRYLNFVLMPPSKFVSIMVARLQNEVLEFETRIPLHHASVGQIYMETQIKKICLP